MNNYFTRFDANKDRAEAKMLLAELKSQHMHSSAFKGITASNFDVIFDHADTKNNDVY